MQAANAAVSQPTSARVSTVRTAVAVGRADAGVAERHDPTNGIDPRWDKDGFDLWFSKCAPFLRVGLLRKFLNDGMIPDDCSSEFVAKLPADAGVSGVQLYAVLSAPLLQKRNDRLVELSALIEVLDQRHVRSSDDDLVFWDALCANREDAATREGMFRMFTHYRIQTIVLPDSYGSPTAIFERLETMAYLALVAFCQRLVHSSHCLLYTSPSPRD